MELEFYECEGQIIINIKLIQSNTVIQKKNEEFGGLTIFHLKILSTFSGKNIIFEKFGGLIIHF